jgi:hypothetical protein
MADRPREWRPLVQAAAELFLHPALNPEIEIAHGEDELRQYSVDLSIHGVAPPARLQREKV